MPIRTMLKRAIEHAELASQHAHLADDLAGGEVADRCPSCPSGRTALHRAADLRGEAEGLRGRVGDEDGLDELAVREPQQEFRRAVDRRSCVDDRRA